MRRPVLNPILGKEFRSRMRNWKSPLIISLYLSALGLTALGYYWIEYNNFYYAGFGPDVGPQIYVVLAVFQLLLVSFVTPAFTAGVINGERERQTFDLLICTTLSSSSIVLNKLLASISYILLLIFASLPVFGIVYLFGGVLLSEIARVFGVYLMTALTFGAIGIFCSAVFKRTQISMVVSYITVLFFYIGTLAVAVFVQSITISMGYYQEDLMPFFCYLNPLVALYSIFPGYGSYSILNRFFGGLVYGGMASGITDGMLAPWVYNCILDGILIIVLLGITILIIDPAGRGRLFGGPRKNKIFVEVEAKDMSL
ncbi:MAG: ABC transporter permease [Syntrophomonadaceae bacterium]|jgi:ABC-2 type transport system permease protein